MVALLGISGLFALYGVSQLVGEGWNSPSALQTFILSASFLLGGVLVTPSAWYAFRRLKRSDKIVSTAQKNIPTWLLPMITIFLIPSALLAGDYIVRKSELAWLLLPGLSLLVTGVPILWLVSIGKRGLSGGSLQRQWGLLAGGLVFSPVIIILVELVALVGVILMVSILIAFNPDLAQNLSNIATQLENSLSTSTNWQEAITPYIQQPVFLAGIFAYTAVLIPLIEEALKPLGLWLLVKRRLSPAEGFVGGMICGAGFGLFENLSALSTGGEEWALTAGMRISTALLHMLTTGVMGWALANAWTNRRYLWLAISYACAVSLHGFWNALSIAGFTLPQYNPFSVETGVVETLLGLTVIGLGVLTGINLLFFIGINRRLRPKADAQYTSSHPQPVIPPYID